MCGYSEVSPKIKTDEIYQRNDSATQQILTNRHFVHNKQHIYTHKQHPTKNTDTMIPPSRRLPATSNY